MGEFILPSSLVLMKFCLRLFLDQKVEDVDFARAIIMFPVDIAFLAFSFSAASIVASSRFGSAPIDVKTVFAFLFGCVLISAIVIVCCKRSDRAFIKDNNPATLAFAAPAYLFSIGIVIASVNAWVTL